MATRGDEDDLVTSRIRLPVLGPRGENFVIWKTQVKSHVTGMGRARYLDGREIAPIKPTLADNASERDQDEHKSALITYNEDMDEWEQINEKIRTILFGTIHETHKIRIANHTTARESWLALCKLTSATPVQTLDQLDTLIAQHASVGGTLTDPEKKSIVLHLLPNSWRENVRTIFANAESMSQFAMQINPAGVPPIYTADMLITAIRNLARDDAAIHGPAPTGGAALVAGANDLCNNCGRKGHWAKDCWSKGGGRAGQRPANWKDVARGNGKGNGRGGGGKSRRDGKGGGGGGNNNNNGGGAGTANYSFAFHTAAQVATDFVRLEETGVVSRGFTALLDSGANQHYCPSRERFVEYETVDAVPIKSADNRTFFARGRGKVPMTVVHGGQRIEMMLLDVLHAPEMPLTLMSVSRMTKSGHDIHFANGSARILTPDGAALFIVPERDGLYPVQEVHASKTLTPHPVSMVAANSAYLTLTLHEFHCRMGHADIRGLQNMINKGLVTGVKLTNDEAGFCKGCAMGILKREPFPHARSSPTAKVYGEKVFSDTWGPAPTASLGRKSYFIVFLDDKSDEVVVTGLEKKNDALAAYKHYEAWAKVHRGAAVIGKWGTDGTHHRVTVHDSSTQNGKAERVLQTLLAHARAMLHLASLPAFLWLEAVSHAAWLRNRTETVNTVGSTPHERATGEKPDLSQLRRFGANVWVKTEGASKIDMQAKACRWMGIDAHAKGHRIYWPAQRKISVERNVRFEGEPEDVTYPSVPIEGELGDKSAQDARNTPAPAVEAPSDKSAQELTPAAQDAPSAPPSAPDPSPELPIAPSEVPSTPRELAPEPSRPKRTREPSQWLRDIAAGTGSIGGRGATKVPQSVVPPSEPSAKVAFADEEWLDGAVAMAAIHAAFAGNEAPLTAFAAMDGDAPTVREAKASPEREKWDEAMKNEVSKGHVTQTCFPSSFVLRRKRDENNNVKAHKARLVAGGHRQIHNVDYTETTSPTMTLATLRFLLALAARYDLEAENIDFSSAYTNAAVEEKIYMEQPPGFAKPGFEHFVCELLKALYGLKQAGRLWYWAVYDLLVRRLGFTRCAADPAVFYIFVGGVGIIIGIHVDDSLILSNSKAACAAVKRQIAAHYEITDLGAVRWLLGFEIRRVRAIRRITMSQATYVDTLADRFHLTQAQPLTVPLDPHVNLYDDNANDERIDMKPYAKLIGSLMYAAIGTRPDVAFAVSLLSRFIVNPKLMHWNAAKHVLRYLISTKNHGLAFGLDDSGLLAYTDADHASQPDRHSISGNAFLYDGAAIAWSSRKQSLIALSSTEAEYIAAASAAREATWLRELTNELSAQLASSSSSPPTPLYCDNQSAIALAKNGVMNSRNKHIDLRYHYIRDAVDNGTVSLTYMPTDNQVADVLTKALPRTKLERFRALMGLRAT
ncbi:Transcription factor [Mycena sanguinolenta]|uniref:Transcription factor n=1 Tax=Mycena sanguinolenta TaxID=230812 RepID=A0A8H6ZH00_9AGAR|nr:Transcription factor [Mycena sanguinolenta]